MAKKKPHLLEQIRFKVKQINYSYIVAETEQKHNECKTDYDG